MRVLLITPPMVQPNCPYPATAYLTGFLRQNGVEAEQADLSLELLLKLFSKAGLTNLRSEVEALPTPRQSDLTKFFLEAFDDYCNTIDAVIRFLQGKDPSLALRLAKRRFVPEGPRFLHLHEHQQQLLSLFGSMGTADQAKYIASLYLDDLSDVIKIVDSRFELSRYGESLASSQPSFTPLYQSLTKKTWIDATLLALFEEKIEAAKPDLVAFSVPFPGNMYAALRMAKHLRDKYPNIRAVMGGGFVNTELRDLNDRRFFELVDYLTYDDGEGPILAIINNLRGERTDLVRTKYLLDGKIVTTPTRQADPSQTQPDYSGLPLDRYISMLELPNPMHRMWSDFRWNKLMLAHGCYWKRCTFCDVNLDYIGRFEPQKAGVLVDQMEALIEQTGSSGFHFVDEAAPPALLKAISQEILTRGLKVSWWGNIRFDKQFTSELTELMADAGCIAVTGGLEVASSRVLKLIDKGVTLEQVARVAKSFKDSGIYVHAYLIYGFASQTEQETIDSLEVVRQLFANGCLDSATWHRFLVTAHSPIGQDPKKFKIELKPRRVPAEGQFAQYEIPFHDPAGVDHDRLGLGLRKALYNYMHGIGIDQDVRDWFEHDVPKTHHAGTFIANVLKEI